jgi:hypothetical protein
MNKQNLKKCDGFQLWWFDEQTKNYFPAGVAFHDEQYGEYRLKIDMHPENQYYLRPLESSNDLINYRVEVIIKKNGKFYQRKIVGEGRSSNATQGDIVISLGPYSKKLILGGVKNDQ